MNADRAARCEFDRGDGNGESHCGGSVGERVRSSVSMRQPRVLFAGFES